MTLTLTNLTKKFNSTIALNTINFEFGKGIYGLLGANGAGKTTLIRCICDLYKYNSGKILYNGTEINQLQEAYRELIGYLPQDFGYYPNYTALNFLKYLGAIKGLDRNATKDKSIQLLKEVGLYEVRNKKLRSFSGGMLRRIGIAQSLLNDPEILILDEPTAGLDPKERIRFKNILSRYSENHTVIISTHIVSDIEYIAKTIIILKDGNILKTGTRDKLLEEIKGFVWEGEVEASQTDELYSRFKVSNIKNNGQFHKVRLITQESMNDNFIQVDPTLDDLYLYYFEVNENESY